ncbi:MAG TPA: UDP-N-acetylmuramoyl-L-alanine--D-glutamate ligase [Pseudomonadales bacterium]
MKTLKNYKLVAGLGKTGMSCIQHYRQLDCPVVVTDSRENPPMMDLLQTQWPEVPVYTGGLNEDLLSDADEIILSPGIPLSTSFVQEAKRKNISVVGDVEVFCRIANAPIIAITGSNAKSTVSTLVAQMITEAGKKVALGGNIGVPVLSLLEEAEPDFYVLELSSFQLETITSLKARVASVLNISPDHMDRYANEGEYITAKQLIYKNCQTAVVNRDDDLTKPVEQLSFDSIYGFTRHRPGPREFGLIREGKVVYLAYEEQKLMPAAELKIRGSHNHENALAALAIGYAAGLDMEAMLAALKNFSGLPHRCQWINTIDSVDWINDSKGTNVGATEAAISGFGEASRKNIILMLGGVGKKADFSPLIQPIKKHVREIIFFGQDAKLISDDLGDISIKHYCTSLSESVLLAKKIAEAGDTVLFSPACASFDMFENFEDRGKQFISLVNILSNKDD